MNTDMFNKTRKRIYGTLMTIAVLLIVLIAATSIAVFSGMFGNICVSMAKDKLDRSISAGRLYIDSIMSTTHTLALNREIKEALEGSGTGTLTSALDAARSYSLYINGITVYGTDGSIYTSSGLTDPPTTEQLRRHADIAEFFDDADSSEYVSLRNSDIIKAYDGTPYNESAGMISCCSKVYSDEGEVIGCIFSDIFPENIYRYFSFEGDRRLKGSLVTIAFGDGYLFSGTADASGYILAAPDTVVNGRLVVSSMRNFYGATVRIAVPLLPLYSDVALIAGVTVACSAALIVATHFIARRAADATDDRLNALLAKMTASTQRFS